MYARNKKTGSRIKGTSEMVSATSATVNDAFSRTGDGELDYQHEGDTEIHWDGCVTQTSRDGKVLFTDEAGEEVTADDIELFEACLDCGGEGYAGGHACQACKGSGVGETEKP